MRRDKRYNLITRYKKSLLFENSFILFGDINKANLNSSQSKSDAKRIHL